MPEDDIIVTHESLASLHQGFAGFAQGVLSHLREAEWELQRQTARLNAAESEAASRVRCIEAEIETLQSLADDDDENELDTSSLEFDLANACSNLRSIQSGKNRVDQAARSFLRESGNTRIIAEKKIPQAQGFLRRRLDDLDAHSAIQIDSFSPSGGSMGRTMTVAQSSPATELRVDDLDFSDSSTPLPKGFQWIPLARIDVEQELRDVRDESDFRPYAPYNMLRGGLDILKSVVLPAIAQHGRDADTFYFSAVDAANGASNESGIQRVYDAFFGGDPIYLDTKPDSSLLSITNGRHRVRVALDAGWKAIPVRINTRIPSHEQV